MNYIDLRSDTITRPSPGMRKAMAEAEVGDDVFREDPTLNELQAYAADLLGKEAALYVPSGVMGNQLCLNILTRPGDEVICEYDAHIFNYESGSPAALSGITLHPLKGSYGELDPQQVESVIHPSYAYYMTKSRVIAVENTHNRAGGTVISLENIRALKDVAERNGLFFHLDGARLWNASVASGISVKEYASFFDTVSVCLSKGLGAPVGSIIAGSKDLMQEAFRKRKAWGGGMRQAGILGAAGLYALKNNIGRMKEDHEKARILADVINSLPYVEIDMKAVQTNILLFKPLKMTVQETIAKAKELGVLFSPGKVDSVRAITHLDVSFEEVNLAAKIIEKLFG
ncbi:MAG: threonine aldolase family protein [Ignavibacteriales bacterium]|nr:MAG: threonine aldolase family protein [Ignavibacteriales bacterium]